MTEKTIAATPKIQFIERTAQNKGLKDVVHDIRARMGDEGRPLVVGAQPNTRYELLDTVTQRGAQKVRANRVGHHLHIFLEGSEQADVVVENYYDEAIVQFPNDILTGIASNGDLSVYVIDETLRPGLVTLYHATKPIVLLQADWTPWLLAGAGLAGAGWLLDAKGSPSDAAAPRPPAAPTAYLDPASDSGAQGDHITNDTTPTLSGTSTAGYRITVKDAAGQVIATAVVGSDGTWSATPTVVLPLGLNSLSVTATDAAGLTSSATVVALTLIAEGSPKPPNPNPTEPTVYLDSASDSGTPGDHITNDTTPTLRGTGTAGHTITVKDAAGQVLATALVADNGTWSATLAQPLPQGAQTLSVTESNAAGQTSQPVALVLTIDSVAPDAPPVWMAPGSDTGEVGDGITQETRPAITGTGSQGDLIRVVMPETGEVLTTTVKADGSWTVSPTQALTPGYTGQVAVTATDVAGNTSAPSYLPIRIVVGDLSIVGSVTAGPVDAGVTLYAYDAQGGLLGSSSIQANGTYRITVPYRGDYRGAVLLKAIDSNEGGANYRDEVTAAQKSLGTPLRAMGVAQEGQTQFFVMDLDAELVIHITPVTELATRKAGVIQDSAPSVALITQNNQAVAKALGLGNVDITARPEATNSPLFDATNGLSASEKYGLLLAKLSGLDARNGGSVAVSLAQLEQNIDTQNGGSIRLEGAALVDQGRQYALKALVAAPSDAEKTFAADSVLNRQLLGDVIVKAQTVDANGKLVVSGTALPGSTVQVTLPDGSTQSATADAQGIFTLTSVSAQSRLDIPLKLVGSDGLSQPAAHTAPAAPEVDTGNGKLVSGTGTPGTTVTVTDSAGSVIGTATVDALGQWSFVPTTPLADNAVLKASAVDALGNVSGPGAGEVDVEQVSVRLAEAADGYINAAEKASGGITFDIGLPASAKAGDAVRTVVSLPDGTSLTLEDVLTQAQIDAGFITRNLSPAQLATDGLYNAGMSLVTQVGQSAPVRLGFIVDTTAPQAPNVAPSNGQYVNGTAEPGTTVTVLDGAGQVIGTAGPVGADGNWTLLPAQPLPNGTVLKATATDVAGNTSGPGSNSVNTNALLITGAIDNVGPQLGLLSDGAATNDTSPQLAGTLGAALLPGQTLVVYRQLADGMPVKVGLANISGTAWTFQDGAGTGLNAPLTDGHYTWQVVVETSNGPVSGLSPSGYFDLVVNTTAPAAPATAVPEASGADTFINAAEKASDAGVPIVTSLAPTAQAGDVVTTTVTLPDGSTQMLTRTLSIADIQSGKISQLLAQSALSADGAYSASTTITSAVNGLVSPPAVNGFTLDTSTPAAGTGALDASSDTGTLGDHRTHDSTPALSGTAEANANVQIVVNGQTYTATANAQGAWSLPATASLPDGTYTPAITVTDAAGNSSSANGTPFTVDATAPAAPGVTIPDASHGVSAAEVQDGVALVVNLPNDAAEGDTLTSVVTQPDGSTLTLTRVLTASDITAGQVTQTVPHADLLSGGSTSPYRDGAWTTSTTLTDTAGNTSAAQTDGFMLSANGPALVLDAVAGDGTVNAAEKSGDLPLSGTTTAEAGQAVTVQLLAANGDVIGTYYTTVKADGSFALTIPQTDLPADGTYSLTADVSNFAGTPAVQQTRSVIFDTTAPVIVVTSVAGDAVTASSDGLFDGTERGFNLSDYTLSTHVATLPVIRGTTDAEAGQSVNVLFNNVSYTTTVQAGGTWAITLTQDEAKALVHGNTYAIIASVSDLAGNPATPDTNNHMFVNIAPPDVPTIDPQCAGTTTPVITGKAQKLASGSPIALAAGDTLSITLNGVTVKATIQASGTATDIVGVTYDPATKAWRLDTATAASFNLTDDTTYDVQVNVSAAGVPARSDISAGELVLDTTPPDITLHPISPDAAGHSVINGFEQGQSLTLTGTTTAQVGSTVTLTGLDGVPRTATVQAGAPGQPNTFSIPVPGSAIQGMTDGPYTPSVSVTNLFGLSGTDSENLLLDTTAPGAPNVALPEAPGGINALEAANGTPLLVTLPEDAAEGDTVTTIVTNPDGEATVLTTVLSASDIAAGQITHTVPASLLVVDGPWTTRTTVTDTAGNPSAPQAGSFVLDTAAPGQPSVALPEAVNGVNAAEALSNGGTPIAVTLPGDALVGDTVTTVVTLPDGSTLTLSQVLTAADITAGSISQLIPSSALTQDGTWTTRTTVTDLAGNVSAPRAGSFVLDTTPPAAPAATLSSVSDSGTVGDSLTHDTTPSISGTGTPGNTITVTFPGGEVKTAVVSADGSWSVTPTTALTDGLNNITVTATDPAGNTSAPTSVPVTIDTSTPAAPTALLAPVSDTGTLGDSLTKDNTPTLNGTGEAGDTITVKNAAGTVIATALVDANGNWSATPTAALPDGLNALSVTATDPAGNNSLATPLPITIDTSAPAAPIAVLAVASDSGVVGDSLTSDNTPSISGTATPGDTVTVTFPGGETATVVVASNGSWSVTPTQPLPDGLNTLSVTATDPAGNTSPASNVPVTVDTTPPAAPAADVATVSDTGVSNTDHITTDTTPTISGAGATPGDTITLYAPNGTTVLGTAVVAAGGTWAITPITALAEGLSTLSVKATDPAGNTSAATPVPVTIDTTPPAAPSVNTLLSNDSTPVLTGSATLGLGETLAVTFNGATYNVTVDVGGNWSLDTGTATPASGALGNFASGSSYPVTATVTDAAGNANSDATTGEFSFDNSAPSVPTVNAIATHDDTPVITGTAHLLAGETLTVAVNGATYTVSVAANGTWSLDTETAQAASGMLGSFADGTRYPITATITDGANNSTSDTSTNELLFDTSAPDAPVAALAWTSDSGTLGDSKTNDTTPTISGAGGSPGDTITVTFPGGEVQTAVVDANGNWAVTPTTALPQGVNNVSVTVTDPAGNVSAPTTLPVTIDTAAPDAPTAILNAASDSGTQGDSKTNDTTPTLSGTGEPDATITVKDANGNVIATATVASDGTWSATSTALPQGLNNLAITATDAAGNTSAPAALPITIDTTLPTAPAAALLAASDTGIAGDAITANNKPTITGTGTAGDTITLKDANGTVLGTAVVALNGTWSITPTTALADGLQNFAVTATDPADNTGPATTVPVTIDTTPPAAPAAALAAVSDSGTVGDSTTSDTTPTISGVGATPCDTITLFAPNGTTVLGTAVVAANGSWAITPTTALANGVQNLQVTATDPQGNVSAPAALPITIDTAGPAAPVAALSTGSDSGAQGDGITNVNTPILSGTGEPNATITVKDANGNVVATAVVNGSGNWTATPTTALPEGQNNLSVTATDAAGNTSAPAIVPVTIDTSVATPAIAPTNGIGAVSGTGDPGATVTLMNGSSVLGTAVVAPDGSWSVPLSAALPDTTALSATAVDVAGNTSAPGTASVNTAVPDINPTNGTTLAGTGKPNDTIVLTLADGTVLRDANGAPLTAVVDANGNWSATPGTPLPDGAVVKATDTTSNLSATEVVDATPPAAPAAALAAISDSGTLGDGITNITTPTLSGTGTPGDTITVKDVNGTTIATATVGSNGQWTAEPSAALPEGLNTLAVTATDPVGNVSAPAIVPVTIVTTAPATPAAPDMTAATDSGGSSTDNATIDTTPDFNVGVVPAGTTPVLYVDGVAVPATVSVVGGHTILTPVSPLTDGAHSITTGLVDTAGNTSAPSAALAVTIDTTVPAAPAAPDLTAGTDTGISSTDNNTGDNTPDFNVGVVPAGTTPVLYVDGVAVPATVSVVGGNTILTPVTPLTGGAHSITTGLVDAAGNTSAPSPALAVTIDTTAPAAPAAPDLTGGTDTGSSSTDNNTGDNTPDFNVGVVPAGTTPVLYVDGVAVPATATTDGSGNTILTPVTALTDGAHSITTGLVDTAGNSSAPSPALAVTIDTTAPATPAAPDLTTDTGSNTTDNNTGDNTPTFAGTGSPGDTITIKDGATVLGTAVVAPDGTWTFTAPAPGLTDGVHPITTTVTDPAGNVSAPSPALAVTIDTTAPSAPVMAPTNGSAITGTGEPGSTVTVMNGSTPVGTAVVAPDGSWTVTPSSALPNGTQLTATQVDPAGNISGPDTETVDASVPSAPDLTAGTDSGNSTDNNTNINTPAFTGTGTPGETVTIKDGTTVLGTAVVDGNGNWTLTSPVLTDGAHQITVTPASGITSPALTVTIDTTLPATPAAPDMTAATDSGSSSTDNNTVDTTPDFNVGVVPAGTTPVLYVDGVAVPATATTDGSGNTILTPVTPLTEGAHNITTGLVDTAGNTSAPSPALAVTIDSTTPAAPAAPDVTAATDSGSSTDNNTGDNTPDFNVGVVPAGTTPVLYVDGVAVPATATTDGSGNTILTPVTPLTEGAHNITTGLVDTAGNASAPSPALAVTIDTTAPAAPAAPDLTAGTDTGSSSTDNNTKINTPDFNVGVVPAGTTPVLYVDGVAVPATATTDGSGNTILTPVTALTDGAHSITTGLVDTAGNASAPSPALAVTIDTTLPATPAAPDLTAGTDTGSSSTDNNTKINTPTFTGTGTSGETITIKDGTTVLGTAVVAPDGTWTLTSPVLTDGVHQITTTATDTAGNTSAPSPALAVTVDTTIPTLTATLNASSDTGTVGDGITTDTTPTISGTGTNGDTIRVVMPGTGEVLTAVVVNGVWSVTPTYALTDGTVGNAVVTATDPAGNVSDPANVPLDIRSAPVAVAITDITNDTGTSNTDGVTTDTTPTISGTSDQPNRPVTVTIAGVSFVVMTDGNGAWSVDTGAVAATSGTWDPAVGFTTDGLKAITASVSGGNGGTGTATGSVTLDTAAPTVLVTSVFGDSVASAANGTFDGSERGFDAVNYTLSPTVSPLPVISGTTTAEDGQTVTVTLGGKSYTATASGGNWSVSVPSADAVLLNHGNTYAITASVSDKAGNAAVADTNNGVFVNIAPPDVPTVVSQSTLSTMPTITGLAQKLTGSSTVNLATGDALTVVIKDAAGTTTLGTYTYTVGGSNNSAGLSYNTADGTWNLVVPAGVLPGAATYNVDVSTTAATLTRSDISNGELVIAVPPTITSIPEGPTVNMSEAASLGGTPVNVGLTGTGAVAGQVITVTWGGQTFTQVLTAADIAANSVAVIVPTSVMQAETPANTTESINVSVSLGNGITSTASSVSVNFVTPTAPTINSAAWTATGAGNTSSILGIPEAQYDRHFTGFTTYTGGALRVDNQLYYSEAVASANSGTIMRVQLPTTGSNPPVAGDTLTVTWGTQILTGYTILAGDITAKFVDITVPFSAISTQPYGTVPVTAVVTSAASGNSSPAASVNVVWGYDMPMDNLASLSGGFAINGRTVTSQSGYQVQTNGVVSVGDVNGDGFDDFSLVENIGGAKYVVYGRAGLTTVELSTLTTVGNTNGFIINGGNWYNTTAGDYNGDGLNDIVHHFGTTSSYVVLGTTGSSGAINITNMAASQGFKITSAANVVSPTFIGDVNGDGLDDMMLTYEVGNTGNYVLYGSTDTSNVTLPTASSGTFSNGFFITPGNTSLVSGGRTYAKSGDFNGDGYSDFVLITYNGANGALAVPEYVFFGGSNLTGITSNSMSVAGSGRGFAITGLTGNHQTFYSSTTGDINGDGMDDMIFNDNDTNAYVLFGKTSDAPVQVASLVSGVGGFVINGNLQDVDVVGDFNGDGLADMVVTQSAGQVNGSNYGTSYLIYGRTATSAITLSNVAPSEGFRIDGPSNVSTFGQSVSAGGDINGDGFADLIITAPQDDPTPPLRTDAGITRVIFGGPTALNAMTFQAANGDAIGTTGADTLTGTSGANQIVAGDGNDTLVGAGGADVLYGGRGDDTLVVNGSNITALATNSGNNSQAIARIDGGSGTDTLEVTASLDLGTVSPAAIQSIERINLSASGTSLKMGLLDVLGLSEKNNPFNTATGWTVTSSGGATNWDAVNNGAQVVVDGTASNDLYLSGTWQSIGSVENNGKTYKVLNDLTNAEAQVIVDSNVKVHMAPTIMTTAEELPGTLNMTEASDGTPVRLSLFDTDAADGNTITLNWGGQTITVTLTATDITNGYVNVPVTLAQLTAETAAGTSEAVAASVTLLSGSTVVAQSGAQAIDVNFVMPTAPTINSVVWAATGVGNTSVLSGIPEASVSGFGSTFAGITGNVDNKLYYNEASNTANLGTIMRVQLPTAGVTGVANPALAGDTLTVTWGDQTLSGYTLLAADITAKYVDITVPFATIDSQDFGDVVVTAVVTSAASGNKSPAATLTVDWAFDLPLENLTSLSAGFAVNGAATNSKLGYVNSAQGAMDVGDVNGDGYDDFDLVDINGNHFVVYGKSGLTAVEVSSFSVAGNTNGYVFNTTAYYNGPAGDINGDGLNDVVMQNTSTTAYVVLGNTRSAGAMTTTTAGFTVSNGFTITSPTTAISGISVVGDVNGDGFDDVLINFKGAPNSAFLMYGSSSNANVTLPTGSTGTYVNGYFINNGVASVASGGELVSARGDFNGDGYSDFIQMNAAASAAGTAYVHFGGSALTGITTNTMSVAGTGRGFAIKGLAATTVYTTAGGDINGDGLEDILINDGSNAANAYVVFGKTSDAPVQVSNLAAGNGGFLLNGMGTSGIADVAMVGDFNGDGLADMLVSAYNIPLNSTSAIGLGYLVYGRTGTSTITLSDLAASEGFRINGVSINGYTGYTIGAAGDVNGDGFADVLISVPMADLTGPARTDAGATRVVYGGVTRINDMVIQASNGDFIGTASAETLTGNSGANQIVAGDGNDTLVGAGGADVLYGGRGDDTIVVNASNMAALAVNSGNASQAIARIDGGNGTDTLEITASLDLGTVTPAAIQSIERINLSASGTSLKMGLLDVLGLSEKNNPFNTATGWTATSTGGATNWDAVNNGAQVVVDGTNTNDLYLSGSWQSIGTVENSGKTYKVLSDLTKAEAQVLVDSNVKVHLAPAIITTANELAGSLNLAEANSSGGTPVRINLVDTDAASGNTIQLNWGGQLITVTLSADDLTAGYVDMPVTTAQLLAATPVGSSANVNALVTLLDGTTAVATSGGQPIDVNFIVPTTPIIDSALWTTTNTASDLVGMPEAKYAMDTTSMTNASIVVDNTLYYSEVSNPTNTGNTILRVQLPTVAANAPVPTVVGDTLTLYWGTQAINVGALSATDIDNKYKDVLVTQAMLETQAFGDVVMSAEITSAASGNTSLTSPITVKWAYDLPLGQLYSLSQGFTIEGDLASGKLGYTNENQGVQNVGDMNGDGYDDAELTDIYGTRYIVYGGERQTAVNVSQLTTVGNPFGFVIANVAAQGVSTQPTRGGDINGDGLSDILVGNGGTSVYAIYGSRTSIGEVNLSALQPSNGFKITNSSGNSLFEPSVVGDVNGDGYEDMLFNMSGNYNNYLIFGGPNLANMTMPTALGTFSNYVSITNGGSYSSGGKLSTMHGDFNGDGYSDFALAQISLAANGAGTGPVYVYYGSANVQAWTSSALSAAGNGRGFHITGLTGTGVFKFQSTNAGDINGDGIDDMVFNDGDTRAFVLFGKTNSTSVTTADLLLGNGGFVIKDGSLNSNSKVWDADVVGDFNGDGLADMVISNNSLYTAGTTGGGAYVVYGRTATTALTLDSLEVSEGFRISGYAATNGLELGRTVNAVGDMNGDGFADLGITNQGGETVGANALAGVVRIVYGGVDKLETMTFQPGNGDAVGTTGADALNGTGGNNQLVAGDGNDTLTGAGGADVLYGGRGDDLIVANADNVAKMSLSGTSQAIARVDGGSGIDTLQLDGEGIWLDLSAISRAAIQGIEKVDLTGDGNNTLKLNLADMLQHFDDSNVFNSSNITSGLAAKVTRNQLMVDGDAGDQVVLTDLSNWTKSVTEVQAFGELYDAYNHNTSAQQLLIDKNVTVLMA